MNTATTRPVISGWSAASPFGIGATAFVDGWRSGRSALSPVDMPVAVPDSQVGLVPGFDPRTQLGPKGTRSMDRVTGLAVTAIGQLLDESEHVRTVCTGEGAGLVLGTTTGSAQSMMDFTRESLTGEKPFFVDPARFPNTVMNCAAGQSAIWHRLQGPNATVAGGRVAGLSALNYARRLLAAGRARSVLCGGVEEYSVARTWLEHRARDPQEPATPPGEGCAVLHLEPAEDAADGHVLAELLAVELAVADPMYAADALVTCIRYAMHRANVRPGEVWAVATSLASGYLGAQESAAVDALLGPEPVRLRCVELIGDTAAAGSIFQVITALAEAQQDSGSRGRAAVVTAVERDGSLGCALLRLR